jgi:ubiquinone/menaquinone biosynthesis C-methylase UbiE
MGMPAWRILWLFGKLGKRMYVIHQQVVRIEDVFRDEDRILDLGGGGAGVIGQLRGQQVTAVDIRQDELDESPPGPIKVVADARSLSFPDGSFDAATAFFFLMYVPAADRTVVLKEAHRVLRPGGTLYIWDAVIPARGERTHKLFVVPVRAELPHQTIKTAYGVPWKGREMSGDSIARMARAVGFAVTAMAQERETLRLALTRPTG